MSNENYPSLNEMRAIFDVLQINPKVFPQKLKNDLKMCAKKMMTTGATEASSISIINACTKKMLEQTVEIDFSLNLHLIKNDLSDVLSCSKKLSKQFKDNIKYHEKVGQITSDLSINETTSGCQGVLDFNSFENDNQTAHQKILFLKKEIDMKKEILKNLQKDTAELHGLPPNIVEASKILAEANEEYELLLQDLEQTSFMNSSSASSFSP